MIDRIVYVCGCICTNTYTMGGRPWNSLDIGKICSACEHPVAAINIDRLLRIEQAVEVWHDARRAGHVYDCEADALFDFVKEVKEADDLYDAIKEGGE